MDIQNEKITRIAVGHSTTPDPFQCGREAAENARRQLSSEQIDLVIAIGPSDSSFKDYIEGVRLSVGESTLIGLPAPWAHSADHDGGRLVILLQGQAQHLSIVSAPEKDNPLRGVTTVMTELRRRRGNSRMDFSFHGLVLFDAGLTVDRRLFAHLMASEAGLESWIAGFGVWTQSGAPLISGSRFVPSGIAAVECLTEEPWGLGWVDTSAFPPGHELLQEASRSALREAIGQLGACKPAAAILLFSSCDKPTDREIAAHAIQAIRGAHPDLPVVVMPARAPYLRVPSGIVTVPPESVIALVIPE